MRRRIVLILVCVLVAILSASATTAWLLLREVPSITVIVTSQPPNASVFADEKALGTAPVELQIARGGKVSLHLIRKDCKDAEVEVNAADYPMPTIAQRLHLKPPSPPCQRTVEMESAIDTELIIKVKPAGAEVFLDGRQLGVAPLSSVRVTPGAHTLRIAHPDWVALTENIVVEAGKPLVIERKLENNRVVAFYRDQIRKNPKDMVNVAELAHYQILHGEFSDAEQTFRAAMANLPNAERIQQQKYFEEMVRFYTKYYIYPKGDDSTLRKACRELVLEAQQKNIGSQDILANYLKQFDMYDKNHPPSE